MFWKFRQLDPPWSTGQKNFFEKINPKLVQNTFGHFWERFGHFCNFYKSFWFFLKIIEDSTLHGTLGKKLFRKNRPKTCSKQVWTLLGTISGIFTIFKNFWLLKFFEDSTLHGTLGKKIFEKSCPKTCSKHVWTLLGTIRAFLQFLKVFDFFENFRRLDPPWNTGQKASSRQLIQNMFKTRLDTFWNDFGLFCNFEKFLNVLKIFDNSTLHGTLGKKIFREN